MPTRTLKRIWCKTCNDFKLHDTQTLFEKDLRCRTCDTEYTAVLLSDIPEEKLVEQRKRYKDARTNDLNRVFGAFMMGNGLSAFESIGYGDEIKESDAGQREIDEETQKRIEIAREERRIQREKDSELKQSFHKLGRNDKCLCGSEKKYKKCCYSKIQRI